MALIRRWIGSVILEESAFVHYVQVDCCCGQLSQSYRGLHRDKADKQKDAACKARQGKGPRWPVCLAAGRDDKIGVRVNGEGRSKASRLATSSSYVQSSSLSDRPPRHRM